MHKFKEAAPLPFFLPPPVGNGVSVDDWGTTASVGIHAGPLDERVAVGGVIYFFIVRVRRRRVVQRREHAPL